MRSKELKPSTEKPKGPTASKKMKKTGGQKKNESTEGGQTKRVSVRCVFSLMGLRLLTYNFRWSDNLVFKLLGTVEDDPEIRQGLYPGTGANASTANGGGKPKTEFYWQLATHLFADHEEYGAPFSDALNTTSKKAQDPWVLKVKNQLNRFVSN